MTGTTYRHSCSTPENFMAVPRPFSGKATAGKFPVSHPGSNKNIMRAGAKITKHSCINLSLNFTR